MMESGENLVDGNSNQVIRQGNTVLRHMGTWSPFVHQLLAYLTANQFTESPVFLGQSEGRERLSFIEGEVGNYPLKPYMQSDAVLIEAAKLLRRFHDLTQNFSLSAEAEFQLPVSGVHEVICHNDFAPYNCVFKEGHLAGIIDFDTAAPGTRLWDIAYAVYRFAPLANDQHCLDCGWQPIPDRARRLRLFCDSYGLAKRADLILTVKARLEGLIEYMTRTASNVEHLPIYEQDLRYIEANRELWTAALE